MLVGRRRLAGPELDHREDRGREGDDELVADAAGDANRLVGARPRLIEIALAAGHEGLQPLDVALGLIVGELAREIDRLARVALRHLDLSCLPLEVGEVEQQGTAIVLFAALDRAAQRALEQRPSGRGVVGPNQLAAKRRAGQAVARGDLPVILELERARHDVALNAVAVEEGHDSKVCERLGEQTRVADFFGHGDAGASVLEGRGAVALVAPQLGQQELRLRSYPTLSVGFVERFVHQRHGHRKVILT
jgi:hypothetical protein